jgi:hypothetical protein
MPPEASLQVMLKLAPDTEIPLPTEKLPGRNKSTVSVVPDVMTPEKAEQDRTAVTMVI